MIKIKLQTNTINEYIDFCKMINLTKCDYFILHEAKKAYSTKTGMIRFYMDIAKIDNKEYKLNSDLTITNVKTGKKLKLQEKIKLKKRGRKSKNEIL